MKKTIKQFLHKNGWYYPIRYSAIFRLYQRFFKPHEASDSRRETIFYKSFLPHCSLVFDIGANDGHKTEAFLDFADNIVSCEPDAENFRLLTSRFWNKKNRVFLENKALADHAGAVVLHIHHPGSAFNTLSDKWQGILEKNGENRWGEKIAFAGKQEVSAITLDILIAKYGRPGFIKIDVEGFEEMVLNGLSSRVPYLSFESLMPEYSREFAACLSRIQAIDPGSKFNISVHEKLELAEFVDRSNLEEWITGNISNTGFEVIVKMS
ncbi:MAG: FkbM family methyltransferase [Chitinophagaceae bacterium]|nr:FkbM family methyltransferase [Chitinophagaceae bacterium]